MVELTNQKQENVKNYDAIIEKPQKKILNLTNKLQIDKFTFEGKNKSSMIFYDTPDNLLTKAGILLYRTIEQGKHFLKMEKLGFLPSVSRLQQTKFFVLPIGPKDTPKTQAFYLINGITEMFTTQFNIDLENVIKVVVPKLEVDMKGKVYKGFRGDGFKFLVEFQDVVYKNYTTKRSVKQKEVTISNSSTKNFDTIFKDFLVLFEKYCKIIVPKKKPRYDYCLDITKIPPKLPKEKKAEKKEKKKKEIKAEDKIEG